MFVLRFSQNMASARFVPPETTLEAFIGEKANKNVLSKTKRDVSLLKKFMRMKGKDEEFVSFSLIGFLSFRYFANMVSKACITKKTIKFLIYTLLFSLIYNKQITPYKVLCTDFIHSFQKLRNSLVRYAHSFVSKVLRLVNKNPYGALSMK